MVRTKIVCTLGPASSNETVLRKMMRAGMDIARLNFSHGDATAMTKKIALIRSLNRKNRRRIAILGDLRGHRIRIGELSSPITLEKHRTVWLTQEPGRGAGDKIPFDYPGPLKAVRNGHHIFIDDGNIALIVTGRAEHMLKARVVVGGVLKTRKGVNIPDARLEFGAIDDKDIRDVAFCEANGVEYIAQSFVRSAEDVREVRGLLARDARCKIVAKIENREGIRNIDSIIAAADGIMIARGDMGVSLPIYEIPMIQKMIIKRCNRARKLVVTATQMLESMTENLRPTRAEVTDVANAILDGTDMVMLSAESAVGAYPAETVAMMNNIIKFTEKTHKGLS